MLRRTLIALDRGDLAKLPFSDDVNNSVKILIDAYTGATTFYGFDTHDPIIAAYRTKLAEAGEKLEELKRTLEERNTHRSFNLPLSH